MKQREFQKILKRFELEFGFKILKRTREREVVEARACLIYFLKRFRNCGLNEIARLIEGSSGWKPNHATILHATVSYDMYARYNRRVDDVLKSIIGDFEKQTDKTRYIKQNIEKMPSQAVSEIYDLVVSEYDKILDEDPVI